MMKIITRIKPQQFIGPLSSEQMADQTFQSNLLLNKITKARNGNSETGRELLRIAVAQLKNNGLMEPNILEYISAILIDVANNPAEQAAKRLLIENIKPKNRPVDEIRNQLIVSCWEAACEVPVLSDPEDDDQYIRNEAFRIGKIIEEKAHEEAGKLWNADYASSLRKRIRTDSSTYELAANFFNLHLKEAHTKGLRMKEKFIKAAGIKSAVNRKLQKSQSYET